MHVIRTLGYPGIIALMAIESACIPLPSEVIMPFSGALTVAIVASAQTPPMQPFNLLFVALAGAVGCAVGSALAWWVGIIGGRPFVEKYGRYLLIRKRDIQHGDVWFARWGGWAVFISRLLPVVRTFISLPAGVSKMRFAPFIALTFIGSLPWCYFLAWIGMKLGQQWEILKTYFHKADALILAVLLILFIMWLWHHLRPKPEVSSEKA